MMIHMLEDYISLNRNIVECKSWSVQCGHSRACSLNRNIVECK